MAGTSKHYVLDDGRTMSVDHKIIPVALTHIKSYYSASTMRTTRDKGTAVIAGLQAMKGPWRTRLLAVWKELKALVGGNMTLVEYRVRPSGSHKSCRFRQAAGSYRNFKPKDPVKGRKTEVAANTLILGAPLRAWGEDPPAAPATTRNNARPYTLLNPPPRRRNNAGDDPVPAAPDARQQLQERLRTARWNLQAELNHRAGLLAGEL